MCRDVDRLAKTDPQVSDTFLVICMVLMFMGLGILAVYKI